MHKAEREGQECTHYWVMGLNQRDGMDWLEPRPGSTFGIRVKTYGWVRMLDDSSSHLSMRPLPGKAARYTICSLHHSSSQAPPSRYEGKRRSEPVLEPLTSLWSYSLPQGIHPVFVIVMPPSPHSMLPSSHVASKGWQITPEIAPPPPYSSGCTPEIEPRVWSRIAASATPLLPSPRPREEVSKGWRETERGE